MQSMTGASFPRSSRLVTARQFQQVFKNSRRIQDDSLTLLVSRYPVELPRLGFAIAKKQVKRAVDRNRLKRLFRESFRRNQHTMPKRDFVIMVRSAVLQLDNRQLNERMHAHWLKAAKL
jgi:ribonuclease P protein component